MALLLKMISGYFSATKKSAEPRCASRLASPVVMPFTWTVISKSPFSGRGGVELDTPAGRAEPAANGAQHHVLDRKAHRSMRRVDVPEHLFSSRRLSAGR